METSTVMAIASSALGLVFVIVLVNTMVGRKNKVEFAFAGIDAMLKKRFDLIPNLVSSVDRYMSHEREVLEEITKLRSRAVTGNIETDDLVRLDNQLTTALHRVFALTEGYPALRASENFLQLQASLNETEEQISAARRAYNAAVTEYNNGCGMFPLSIVARVMGYRSKPCFEIAEEERRSVKVVWR